MSKELLIQSRYWFLIVFLCAIPSALNLLGIDLGSTSVPLGSTRITLKDVQSDDLFLAIKGGIHHALFEWSAVSVAFLTAFVSFLHFSKRKDVTVPIIGMALLGAGFLDVYHTLAATRIIGASSANTDFIPFTWALSRMFNATIMILGVGMSIWLTKKDAISQSSQFNRRTLVLSGGLFVCLSILSMVWVSASPDLPQTMYPGALITRPFDVLPLTLFILGGTLVWSWYKIAPSLIKFALLLSLVPSIATQLHMAFGSTQFFDNHFNIAHGLKIVAYGCIFVGIIFDLVTKTKVHQSKLDFRFSPVEKKEKETESADMLVVGSPKISLTVAIPLTLFLLVLTIATIVGGTFYLDSEKLAQQKEIKQLKTDSQYIAPMLEQFYSNTASDLLFLSQTPPITTIQQSIYQEEELELFQARESLNTIFSRLLDNKPYYRSIRYIGMGEAGLELSVVKRRASNSIAEPTSRLTRIGDESYYTQTMKLDSGEFYLSKIGLEKRNGQIVRPYNIISQLATPIFSVISGEPFGIVIIDTDFGAVIDDVLERTPEHMQLYIANADGDFLYHPQGQKAFGFEFEESYTLQKEFPSLAPLIQQGAKEHFLTGVSIEQPQLNGKVKTMIIAGYYSLLDFEVLDENRSLQVLFTIDENELARELRALRDRSLVIGLSLSLLTLALAIIVSRRFVVPIRQMTSSMRQFSKTGLTPSLPIQAKDELGVLARNFHNLTIQLSARDNELREQKFVLDQHAIVAVTDLKGKITFANQRFADISGYSVEELIGQDHSIINSGYHDRDFFNDMYKTIAKGNVWHGEIRNKAKGGQYYWVDTTIAPFMHKGKPVSYIAIRTDITKSKEYEHRLLKAKEEAESATRIKSEFIASMSHEIRTPMNGVIGMIELLLKTQLDQEQKHKLSVIKSSANSLLVIINDILDFSKIEAGKMELELLPFDLGSQLTDYIQSMATKADEKNLELILDMTELSHPHVLGDPGRIRQIFNNLIGNALKFTETGEVVVKASTKKTDDNHVIFHCKVSDTGIGIPADKLDVLFKSFRQVDASTTRKYGGTGLGLTIVKQLCELMHGDITVLSTEGQGSSFEFYIPLELSEQPTLAVPQVNLHGLSILLVDDNRTNLEVMAEQLGNWGVNVYQAISAEQAMQLCEEHFTSEKLPFFDIAILDMQMPQTSGEKLGRMIKADGRFSSIKMIMMSSITAKGDAQHFADLGFSAYFPKPTTPSILHDSLSILVDSGLAENYAQPLVTSHYLKQLKRPVPEVEETDNLKWPKGTRILLVEDNLVNQQVAEAILEEFNLYADIADNGQQALDKLVESATNEPYKLILMDCLMPIIDGYDATRQIRAGKAGKRYSAVPIVALTANAMKQDKENCLNAGMDDFVAKPIATDELLAVLKKWLLNEEEHSNEDSPLVEVEFTPSPLSQGESVWDPQLALKQLSNNQELMERVVKQALISIPEEFANLKVALSNGSLDKLERVAHTLKGVCLTLHASNMSQMALEIETCCRENQVNKLSEILPDFERETNDLLSAISTFLNPPEEVPDVSKKSLTDRQVYAQLITMQGMFSKGSFVDGHQIDELINHIDRPNLISALEELKIHFNAGNNERCLTALDDMIDDF